MIQVFVGLGSNLGDRMEYLKKALTNLTSMTHTSIKQCSSVYETERSEKENNQGFSIW